MEKLSKIDDDILKLTKEMQELIDEKKKILRENIKSYYLIYNAKDMDKDNIYVVENISDCLQKYREGLSVLKIYSNTGIIEKVNLIM